MNLLDNLLNFKHFSFMDKKEEEFASRPIETVFLERATGLGANCGVLVWKAEDGFIERARFGYGEEGFFYEFMARGQGNIELLSSQEEILVFPASKFHLYHEDSNFAVVSGIYSEEEFCGFLLLELSGDPKIAQNIAFLLARYLEMWGGQSSTFREGNPMARSRLGRDFLAIQVLLKRVPSLNNALDVLDSSRIALILGPKGSGKKSLARFYHKTRSNPGNILILNTVPENLGKLEKALLYWESIALPQGILVFDKLPQLKIGQQRIFFEWLGSSSFPGKIFFVDRNEKKDEIYSPFWNLLEKSTVALPSLDSLPKQVLGEVVDAIFQEICEHSGKEGLRLNPEARERLRFSSFPGNLEELRSILVHAIWRSRGLEVDLDFSDTKEGHIPSADLPLEDDLDLPKCIAALERQKILLAQKLFSGNQIRMAKALKISRGSLQYKMRNLGLL